MEEVWTHLYMVGINVVRSGIIISTGKNYPSIIICKYYLVLPGIWNKLFLSVNCNVIQFLPCHAIVKC